VGWQLVRVIPSHSLSEGCGVLGLKPLSH